jgi:hypothetical protein
MECCPKNAGALLTYRMNEETTRLCQQRNKSLRTWSELLQERLAADPAEAAAYLRVALAEATEDPQDLLLTV